MVKGRITASNMFQIEKKEENNLNNSDLRKEKRANNFNLQIFHRLNMLCIII